MATRKSQTTTTNQLPAHLQKRMGQSRGNENVSTDDIIVPRLGLIQALSPEIDGDDAKFIPGAKQGQLFNALTREVFDGGLDVINVAFRKEYPIFKQRKKGGGLRYVADTMAEAVMTLETFDDKADLEIIETGVHFCLLIHPATLELQEVVLPCSVTKLKFSRQWNSLIRLKGGDRFAAVWRVKSAKEQNNAGQTYFNYGIEPGGWTTEEQYLAAESLYEMIAKGDRKVDHGEANEPKDEARF